MLDKSEALMKQVSTSEFFDEMAVERDAKIAARPVVAYEQEIRAQGVMDLLQVVSRDNILDVGCGNGRDLEVIAATGASVFGVDSSGRMIDSAKERLHSFKNVSIQEAGAERLPFTDESFDKVLLSEVIEHVNDPSLVLREIHRILVPLGILVLSTPNRRSWYGFDRYFIWQKVLRKTWDHPHDCWMTHSEISDLLTNAGFDIVKSQGGCYVPGFLLTYTMPRFVQKLIVRLVKFFEPTLRFLFPSYGYEIFVSAVKVSASGLSD